MLFFKFKKSWLSKKQLFASHDDIYLKISITGLILLNDYFLWMCSFFLNTVFYINCINELCCFRKKITQKWWVRLQKSSFKWFLTIFLLQFSTSQKNVLNQCCTQGFFGHTIGNIFSDSQSAPHGGRWRARKNWNCVLIEC